LFDNPAGTGGINNQVITEEPVQNEEAIVDIQTKSIGSDEQKPPSPEKDLNSPPIDKHVDFSRQVLVGWQLKESMFKQEIGAYINRLDYVQ